MPPIERKPVFLLKEAARAAMMLPRRLTARSRMLPDWLIIGTQKGGTTSLYAELCRHPQVAAAFRKEPHFFDEQWERGIDWYRANFDRPAPGRVTGEASPYYLFDPAVPPRVQQVLPQAKLIVMLRNPVDRAWSHYHHERRRGHEDLPFEEAIEAEAGRLAMNDPYALNHHSYLARGRYAEQLARWYKLFPGQQLHIIRSEDYYADPAAVYAQTLQFLGLPDFDPGRRRKLNAGTYRDRMDNATRDRLHAYFEPHNRALDDLIGWDMRWHAAEKRSASGSGGPN